MTTHEINDIKDRALDGNFTFAMALELVEQIPQLCDEINLCHKELAQCFKISGADSDGNEDWRIAHRAVEAVQELRNDYDVLAENE